VNVFNEILGREVEIPEEPHRIVSFSPSLTETLFMLGLEDRIAGVSAFCARPPAARKKRKVGSYSTVRNDLLRELKPDLILTVTGYQRDFAFALAESFPVYPFELPASIAGITDMVVKLGLLVGKADRGWSLSSSLARGTGLIKPISRSLSVYVEIDLGGPVSFGAYSYITNAIHYVGATSLFDDVRKEWLTPDLKIVQRTNPDVFLYEAKMFSSFDKNLLRNLVQSRGWSSMKAIKRGNYFLTPGPLDFLAHHGPSFLTDVLPWIREKLSLAAQKQMNSCKN
jgi:ABC-type Fe3+-hydroxamate transport system substrate-binding protein